MRRRPPSAVRVRRSRWSEGVDVLWFLNVFFNTGNHALEFPSAVPKVVPGILNKNQNR